VRPEVTLLEQVALVIAGGAPRAFMRVDLSGGGETEAYTCHVN
jgi:hypothetical protein